MDKGQPADGRVYNYGYKTSPSGKLLPMVSRAERRHDYVLVGTAMGLHAAESLADKCVAKLMSAITEDRELNSGALISLVDPDGVHIGVLINLTPTYCDILIATSSNSWNSRSILATNEELGMIAFMSKVNRQTYLAPLRCFIQSLVRRPGRIGTEQVEIFRRKFDFRW